MGTYVRPSKGTEKAFGLLKKAGVLPLTAATVGKMVLDDLVGSRALKQFAKL